jgi:hypothetical protein
MADDSTRSRTDERRLPERFVIEVVLNRRRRYALYYLFEHAGPMSVEDIAAQVAAWEQAVNRGNGTNSGTSIPTVGRPEDSTEGPVEPVSTSLSQHHLPRLDELGLVSYDRRTDRATCRVADPNVALFVTNDPRTTVAWHRVYLTLTALSAVFVGLTYVGVSPLGDLDPVVAAGVVVAVLAVASIAYWYDVRRSRRRNEGEHPDFVVSLDEEIPFEESAAGEKPNDEDSWSNEDSRDDENAPDYHKDADDEDGRNDVRGRDDDGERNDQNT